MSGTRYYTYEIQLQDGVTGQTIAAAGGAFIVTGAGDTAKVAVFNADTFAAMANPVVPTRGRIRFATLATIDSVDLYGFAPGGQFIARSGVTPGGITEIPVDTQEWTQVAQIPFAAADYTAATEGDTGLDLPLHALVLPFPAVRVVTAEGSRAIDVGLLSSETAGDADGLVDGVSLANAGLVDCATSGTPTLGALLVQNFGTTPAVNVRDAHATTGTNARSITITPSASTASAKALVLLPYSLAAL
jgi:hypothetical protein